MIVLGEGLGVYRDAALRADNPRETWTALVAWPELGGGVPEVEEEVDVEAATERHAREIASAALRRDYEPGWKIVYIESREEN